MFREFDKSASRYSVSLYAKELVERLSKGDNWIISNYRNDLHPLINQHNESYLAPNIQTISYRNSIEMMEFCYCIPTDDLQKSLAAKDQKTILQAN